ncbi:hypothetical protein EYF80_017126 [Liparis tanakae]|uniref:Uncharacterized protein n=1 Tax=Liparis tanakae TaxID=230148 RepID=A0A4Z2I3W8_9TELE|nr:hypothetical protein EYF80_017126 [Liparis tanakae]
MDTYKFCECLQNPEVPCKTKRVFDLHDDLSRRNSQMKFVILLDLLNPAVDPLFVGGYIDSAHDVQVLSKLVVIDNIFVWDRHRLSGGLARLQTSLDQKTMFFKIPA